MARENHTSRFRGKNCEGKVSIFKSITDSVVKKKKMFQYFYVLRRFTAFSRRKISSPILLCDVKTFQYKMNDAILKVKTSIFKFIIDSVTEKIFLFFAIIISERKALLRDVKIFQNKMMRLESRIVSNYEICFINKVPNLNKVIQRSSQ